MRAHSVPATVIDIGTGLVEDWPQRASISDTSESDLITSCLMLSSCLESLASTFESIKIAVTMWAKHVEVAKRQEGITNDTFCPRRKRRMNNLLKLGTGCGRLCTVMRVSVVVISFEVSRHVEGT